MVLAFVLNICYYGTFYMSVGDITQMKLTRASAFYMRVKNSIYSERKNPVLCFVIKKFEQKFFKFVSKPQLFNLIAMLIIMKCIIVILVFVATSLHRPFPSSPSRHMCAPAFNSTTSNNSNNNEISARAVQSSPAAFVYYIAFTAFVCFSISH